MLMVQRLQVNTSRKGPLCLEVVQQLKSFFHRKANPADFVLVGIYSKY